ncbi:MAG: T9SS type A sorting domain-containing protein [Ignavibacteriae bacterium]|nr:T9SS C-terminal target domain-containing protein [Ignavibacteriota bacterium]NOH00311.1 T9SS type A sorting domain-containing protein [Ignavibacteriota bacterium]
MIKYSLIIISFFYCVIVNMHAQDFQVSMHGAAGFAPDIAADSLGNFIVVWSDYRNSYEHGGSDSGSAIYGQLFSNNGSKFNDNFRISENTLKIGNRVPSVDMNSQGDFVVAWHKSNPQVWGDTDVYARIFSKNGFPKTHSFKVNDDTTSKSQLDAKVILQDNGTFVVCWADRRDGPLFSYAQLYDASGAPIEKNFRTNVNDVEDQAHISQFTDGKFLFNWNKYMQVYNKDGSLFSDVIDIGVVGQSFAKGADSILTVWVAPLGREVWGNFFDLDGNQIGQPFRIDNDSEAYKSGADVGFSKDGTIIVWQDHRNDYPGEIGNGDIYAQRFNYLDKALGENFKVNHEPKELTQRNPTVIMNNKQFITAWLEIHPKCSPEGTIGVNPSHILGTIQDFTSPVPGVIFGWETLQDSCDNGGEYIPSKTEIFNNYPNPFSRETNIKFSLSVNGFIDMSVYNMLGERITTLINAYKDAGSYQIKFDSSSLASGVYIILLKGYNFILSSKMIEIH